MQFLIWFVATIFQVKLDMVTKDVDCSCKLYTRVGYLCSHTFLTLGISGIHSIPRQYVCNRWLKRAEERFSTLELGSSFKFNAEEESKRVKTRDCWFEFQACMSDAAASVEHIDYVHKGLIALRENLNNAAKTGGDVLTDRTMEDFIGSSVVDDITILPPNQSNNKGCRKRIVGAAEKNVCGTKRQMRMCKACHTLAFHDSRNCPTKK